MSMTTKSYEQILNDMKSRAPEEMNTSEGSFVDAVLRPVAFTLAAWNFSLSSLTKQVSPDTATGMFLENQAKDYGILRKPGSKATARVTFCGADGITVPQGTAVQTKTGLVYLTDEAVTIAAGVAEASVTAEYPGVVCNVAENAICMLQSLSTVTVQSSTAAAGGVDVETDDELRARLQTVRRRTPASCNEAQYEAWAMEVSGVGRVRVIGRWNGPGTVKILLADENMAPAPEGIVQAVREHLEPKREICTEITCEAAKSMEINVSAQIVLAEGASLEQISVSFSELLTHYLANIALTGTPVVYNRVAYMLLSIEGVTDFVDLAINGGEANIPIDRHTAPCVGVVSFE